MNDDEQELSVHRICRKESWQGFASERRCGDQWYGSRSYIDQKYASVYQNMFKLVDAECMDDNMKELAEQVDVVFTATPQAYAPLW